MKINGMAPGAINNEPVDGDNPEIVEGAAGGTVREYAAIAADGAGAFVEAAAGDDLAGIAPRRTVRPTGALNDNWVQYDEMGVVVAGTYPTIIEKTAALGVAETLEPGLLLDLSATAGQVLDGGAVAPVVKLVDRIEFETTDNIADTVIARVVLP